MTRTVRLALEKDDVCALSAAATRSEIASPFMIARCIRYKATACMRFIVDKNRPRVEAFFAGILRDREDRSQEDTHSFIVECIRREDAVLFGLFIRSHEMTALKWALYMDVISDAAVELSEGIVDELTTSPVFLESIRYNLMDLPKEPALIIELMDSVMSIAMGDRTTEAYLRRLNKYYTILEYKAVMLQYIGYRIICKKEPLFRLYQEAWCRPETIVFLIDKIKDLSVAHTDVLASLEWQRLCVKGPLCVWRLCALTDIGFKQMQTMDKTRWPSERQAFVERGRGSIPPQTDLAVARVAARTLWTTALTSIQKAEPAAYSHPMRATYDKETQSLTLHSTTAC